MYECCRELHLDQSMGRTGVCWDNAMIESQWSVLKAEFYDRYEWDTPQQAIQGVEEWIYDFYNTKRLNSAVGYQTPAEFEAHHTSLFGIAVEPGLLRSSRIALAMTTSTEAS